MKKLLFIVFILATTFCFSQSLNIIPEPAKVEMKQGNFIFTSKVDIIYNDSVAADIGKKIIDTLKRKYSVSPTLADSHPYHNNYKKFYIEYNDDYPQKEGYKLNISE